MAKLCLISGFHGMHSESSTGNHSEPLMRRGRGECILKAKLEIAPIRSCDQPKAQELRRRRGVHPELSMSLAEAERPAAKRPLAARRHSLVV